MSGGLRHLTWRLSRRTQGALALGRGFSGLGGTWATARRSPSANYLIVAGVVWTSIWTAYLASISLRGPRH